MRTSSYRDWGFVRQLNQMFLAIGLYSSPIKGYRTKESNKGENQSLFKVGEGYIPPSITTSTKAGLPR